MLSLCSHHHRCELFAEIDPEAAHMCSLNDPPRPLPWLSILVLEFLWIRLMMVSLTKGGETEADLEQLKVKAGASPIDLTVIAVC